MINYAFEASYLRRDYLKKVIIFSFPFPNTQRQIKCHLPFLIEREAQSSKGSPSGFCIIVYKWMTGKFRAWRIQEASEMFGQLLDCIEPILLTTFY